MINIVNNDVIDHAEVIDEVLSELEDVLSDFQSQVSSLALQVATARSRAQSLLDVEVVGEIRVEAPSAPSQI